MPDKILPDIYRIEIPLPKNPLKILNSYVIRGPERSLVIDTGFNIPVCREAMLSGLKEVNVDIHKTDFLITHMHVDHLGQVFSLADKDAKIFFNRVEAELLFGTGPAREKRWQEMNEIYISNGFPQGELEKSLLGHAGYRAMYGRDVNITVIGEPETITVGDYAFRVIETPGHSPGHICLYDPNRKILIAGDCVLFDITPNISFWSMIKDSLGSYFNSLDKVYALDVNMILPGHRRIMNSHRERIDDIKKHHRARLDEVITALKGGNKSVWEIAPYLSWDIISDTDSWEDFPSTQKWFAFGETLAHIVYLEEKHEITREVTADNKILFSLA